MSAGWQFFLTTMLVYLGTATMACWGLNLQFGETGVLNFAFIIFEAAGAYTTAVLTLGPDTANGAYQHYILGLHLPFPVPWLASMAVGGGLGVLIGVVGLRRLRGDYQALIMLVISLLATDVISAATGLFNGASGLSLVPAPLASVLGLGGLPYRWFYVLLTFVAVIAVYLAVRAITGSPLGRSLRAVRENEAAAAAIGKDVTKLRLLVMGVGGAIAALSGAILVQLIGSWAPGGWTYPETFTLFAAVLVGGRGNNWGVALGAFLVPVLFLEGVLFLPSIGNGGLVGALQWVTIGALILICNCSAGSDRNSGYPWLAGAELA